MKKTLITSALIFAFSTNLAAAEIDDKRRAKNELVGLGSGVLIGAAIGGPVGGLVGGIFGVVMGDDYNDTKNLELANQEINENKQSLALLEKEYEEALLLANQKASQLEQVRLVSLQTELEQIVAPVETSIQFKTASHNLQPHYQKQLDIIAQSLLNNENTQVVLEGHSDRRGDQSYNEALSEQRVISVKNYLKSQGVKSNQIQSLAFGESQPLDEKQSFENDFFDRRVVIKIEAKKPVLTAAADAQH
ncbi:sortase-associated OmpA-like protein PdsO [Alteromonadaceae bacterium M269]|nr:sortase-associated OmpA-like protein PdsO [Alteromonadaceae bacterium M269]